MDVENFYDYSFGIPDISFMQTWPTKENPYNQLKFGSAWIELSTKQTVVARSTYSLLDWLGDLGGLFDALYYMASLIVRPASAFALQATMLVSFFR